ncbi:MAG TPA: NUDIX domain-containing protein [Geobacterales bacterium]|nr:NUDIX domain-containing protein [Geobacterales bacterium]
MPNVILCDEKGNPIGETSVEDAHSGSGKRHLAFVIVIEKAGKVLVQRRAKNKRFPGYWEFPASHIFVGETWENALKRTLKKELGIDGVEKFERLFHFIYSAKGERETDVENEYCVVFKCVYNGEIKMNTEEADQIKFVRLEDLEMELKGEKISAWLKIPVEIMLKGTKNAS